MPQNNSTSSSFLQRLSTSTSSRSSFMSPKEVRCNVHLLHDSDIISNEFPRTQSAQTVLDYVCELKHIEERDFLGLRYQDHNKHRYWLDLTRSIGHVVKQFRTDTMTLHLRFRYYPSDPARLRDPNLRYQLFVQLQRDLLHGRLYCPATAAAELAALILQAQLGDYDEHLHQGNYVSEYKLLLKQTPKLEERIAVLHKELVGKSSADAELEFLEKASQLDTYAFDPYTIKDTQDPANPVYLGASGKGILIYANQSRTHFIDWSELVKVDYSGREIKLMLAETYRGGGANGAASPNHSGAPQKKPLTLKYQCPSAPFAKHLWIHILSQQAFFNESSAQEVKLKFSKPRIPLLSRGSTFRFPSKKVYREIEEEDARAHQFDTTLLDSSLAHNELNDTSLNSTSPEEHHDAPNHQEPNADEDSPLNVSSMSVPTVSSATSTVQRYELLRQTPRVEQPWLAKPKIQISTAHSEEEGTSSTATTPEGDKQNNNKAKIANLNVSLQDNGEPSASSSSPSPPPIVHTYEHADHNSTSFTVHLIKREELTYSAGQGSGQERVLSLEHKFNELVEQDVDFGRPLASSTPRSTKQVMFEKNGNGNGKLLTNGEKKLKMSVYTNGHALLHTEEKQDSLDLEHSESVAAPPTKSVLSRITNTFFVLFLMFLLTLAIVICLFEKSDSGSAHNDWIEQNRQLSDLRHLYYEPTRHYVVEQYRKYFGAKI